MVLSEDEKSDTEDQEETEVGVMEDQRSVILHLISQLKLGMDLTKVGGHIPWGLWPVVWVPSVPHRLSRLGDWGCRVGKGQSCGQVWMFQGLLERIFYVNDHPQSMSLAFASLEELRCFEGRESTQDDKDNSRWDFFVSCCVLERIKGDLERWTWHIGHREKTGGRKWCGQE